MPASFKHPGVYVEEIPSGVRSIEGVPTNVAAFIGTGDGGPLNEPVHVLSEAEFQSKFGAPARNHELGYAMRQFFLNGGTQAWVVRVPDATTEADWRAGIAALDEVDDLNLLALPGMTAQPVLAKAAGYCEKRRAFLLIDPLADAVSPAEVLRYVSSGAATSSGNAALYYPWVQVGDGAGGGEGRWCAPSGTMAGVIVRTDAARGVWKAPAGTEATLAGVAGLRHRLSAAENGQLNPQAVNCLRAFPGSGMVAWGARTRAGADTWGSEWKYIPVRRLALYLEESLYGGTKWTVFESNDEPLWAQLRLNVGAFMHGLFRQGALVGATPEQAYFVKCDRETTTQADVSHGVVNLVVGFAPLKPAEFVILRLQLLAGQTSA